MTTTTNKSSAELASALSENAGQYNTLDNITCVLRPTVSEERELLAPSIQSFVPLIDSLPASPSPDPDPETERLLVSAKAETSRSGVPVSLRRSRRVVYFRRMWDVLRRCFSSPQSSQSPASKRAVINAAFTPSIVIEVDCGIGCRRELRYQKRYGMAMIDIQSEHSLISRGFADLLFADAKSTELESATPYPVLETLGGPANAIMQTSARWYCENGPGVMFPWPRMNPKLVRSKFHVMEKNCQYDVIIGLRDIAEFDLLGLRKLPLAAAHNFRSQPYAVDSAHAATFDAARIVAQQSELETIKQDRAWKEQCREYATRRAHQAAHVYADEEAQRLGRDGTRDDAWYQIFKQAYAGYYDYFAKEYQQHYPRPN